MLTYNAEAWKIKKKNKRKIQSMGMKFLEVLKGKQEGG
jgi:hypothetical protein